MSRPRRFCLLLRACTWILRVEWNRRRRSFGDLLASIEEVRLRERPLASPDAVLAAARAGYRFTPFRRTCLNSSLVAVGLLRSLGHPARLAIGVRGDGPPVDAHAWVELEGSGVRGNTLGYRRLIRLEVDSRPSTARAADRTFETPCRTDRE